MATVRTARVRPGRGQELLALVLAIGLGIGAYVTVAFRVVGELPADAPVTIGVIIATGLIPHLVLRWRAPYADPVILPVAVALNGIGLAMIWRIDLARQAAGRTSDFAERQLMWTGLSVALATGVLIWLRDHRTLRRFTYIAMLVGLGLIVLPLVPGLRLEVNGASIWIKLGPFSLQPAELAKIALAIFFAGYLVSNRETLALAGPTIGRLHLPRLRDLGPIIVVWAASIAVLVLQRDLGTSLLIFGLFVAMLYLATERTSWVLIGLALFGAGAAMAATAFGHVGARFDVWLHAMDKDIYARDPGGSGQLVRGLFGMASGGLFGTGWGQGRPDIVPYSWSDFIVSSLGEELGLTGLVAILLCYLILVQRGLRTAIGVRDGFGKLLAGGLAFAMALQVFVVVGGITRLIPLTGLTTPFLAAGGSSLLANWIIVALLLRISDDARRPAPAVGAAPVAGPTPVTVAGSEPAAVGRPAHPTDEPAPRSGSTPTVPARRSSADHATEVIR